VSEFGDPHKEGSMRITHVLAITALLVLSTLAVACGDDDDEVNDGGAPTSTQEPEASPTAATIAGEATSVHVSLGDHFILAEPASAPAGTITFEAKNVSTSARIGHELIVLRTDLPLDDLPVTSTGAMDETSEEIEIVGQIGKLSPGNSKELAVDLEPGIYGLVCNIYVEDEGESHYQRGMWSEFTVE
jgi:uncharacterized cupredoxin-like copper-binding protein